MGRTSGVGGHFEKQIIKIQDPVVFCAPKMAEKIDNEMEHLVNSQPKTRLLVVKVGGNVINDEVALDAFLKNFSRIEGKKILVHGGGKKASEIGEKLGIVSHYVDGRRITDQATIDLVTMVYGGLVNKKIVARLQAFGCNALGLTGADANSIPADRRPVKEIDYGFVGDIENEKLNVTGLKLFLGKNLVPVFAPLTHDNKGQILNTNADTIAAALAVALARHFDVRLMYCFEKKGVLKDVNNEEDVVPLINKEIYKKMLAENKLTEGILPKLHNAFQAIDKGVSSVLIGHATEVIKNSGAKVSGTLIKS